VLVPSKKFRLIHPDLLTTIKRNRNFTIIKPLSLFPFQAMGVISLVLTHLEKITHVRIWRLFLSIQLRREIFNYVHLVEIQGAGYLFLDSKIVLPSRTKLIVTNWGSDIFFFQHNEQDRKKIQQVLRKADLYSAECHRDYKLARKLGFTGSSLPCIPNAGGFQQIPDLTISRQDLNLRRTVVCKAYGGQFGLGNLLLEVSRTVLERPGEWNFYFYSVTDDLLDEVKLLERDHPGKVRFSAQREKLSQAEMRQLFLESRIYMGASRSDGLSTSFLEALCFGAYPIQTNTSCADEMLRKGFQASIVEPKREAIQSAFDYVSNQVEKLTHSALQNNLLAREHLDFEKIKSVALGFYLKA